MPKGKSSVLIMLENFSNCSRQTYEFMMKFVCWPLRGEEYVMVNNFHFIDFLYNRKTMEK